jgi:hypothetical protein
MTHRTDEEIIAALQAVDVPEPSPLFWDHLSQRVREAVAAEPVPASDWTSRFRLAWATGVVAALAMVVIAVTMTTHRTPQVPGPASRVAGGDVASVGHVQSPIDSGDPIEPLELSDDASWAVMGDLASQMDWDEAAAAGLVVTPGAAEGALSQLSGDEQRAVVEILQQEMPQDMKSSKPL